MAPRLGTPLAHRKNTMSTIRQRGNKWQAIVRVKKDGAIVHQESKTFESERLAKDWAKRVEQRLDQNGIPQRSLEVETLGSLIQKYADMRDGIKPLRRTVMGELQQLAAAFGSVKLSAVTSETFTKFALARNKAGVGPATIQHNLATMRAVLGAAKSMFKLNIDGAAVAEALVTLNKLGLTGKGKSRTRRVTDAELDQLQKEFERIAFNPSTEIPMATIIRLSVALPRRRTELVSMRWADYDPKAGVVLLRDTKNPKEPRDELIPVPPAAAAILKGIPVVDERILPYEPESISASFQRACNRLGIEDLRLHDLRHEGISRLFEQGLDIPEVAMISGHLSWATLKRYTHLKPANVLEKLNRSKQ